MKKLMDAKRQIERKYTTVIISANQKFLIALYPSFYYKYLF